MTTIKERQKKILKETVETFIESGEPVGSKQLVARYDHGLSSATIRNDLNKLVQAGYLYKPHVSSGRIPTDNGYRAYVNNLDTIKQLPPLTLNRGKVEEGVRDLLNQVGTVVTKMINYTTIMSLPEVLEETLKAIHLILTNIKRILVVLISTTGEKSEFFCNLSESVGQEDLNKLGRLLTEALKDYEISKISPEKMIDMISKLPQYATFLKTIVTSIDQHMEKKEKTPELSIIGRSKMLQLPEFKDVELVQKVMSLLDETKTLHHFFKRHMRGKKSEVVIGREGNLESLNDCSLVIGAYKMSGQIPGYIGILGPKRMQYSKLIPMVNMLSTTIETLTSNK